MFALKKTEGNFRWQTSHRHLHGVERQPEGVQVVEGVGLVASGFKFLLGLAAVFAVAWVHLLCQSQETQLYVIGRQFRGVNCSNVGRP